MSARKDEKLSAYFTGLIDVCEGEEGESLFLTQRSGERFLQETAVTESCEVVPPQKHHFPYIIPRASKVLSYAEREDKALYSDVMAYLQRFSALDEDQWSIVAHYVFLTYLHDHKSVGYCPILLFFAVPERGKSRTGKSVSYVAFRGVHLIELREANVFRYSQNLHGTLFFDLMDVWKKAERNGCEDVLLGRYEKGQKCSRILYPDRGPFKDTVYYEIFGPTIVATNEPLHKILDTRCLPIIMPNRPGNYENPSPDLALDLKERLTAWRARHLYEHLPDIEPIDGISGRLWDITKPLFQVGSLVNPAGRNLLKKAILGIAGERCDSKKDTTEGRIIGIIKDLSAEKDFEHLREWTIKTSEILQKFNEGRPVDKHVTSQWIGKKLKSLSLRHRTVNGRSEIMFAWKEYWTLVEQYGCCPSETPDNEFTTETPHKEVQSFRLDIGIVGSGRFSPESFPSERYKTLLTPEELEEFTERVAILISDGCITPEEAEENAYIMTVRKSAGGKTNEVED